MKLHKIILSCILPVILAVACFFVLPVEAQAAKDGYYTYTVSNGEARITDCSTSISDITIPSTLGGYPVTSIGNYAFSYWGRLTSITIPDSVTSIGDSAFYNCESLTSVTIGSGVTSIGKYAFDYCRSLTDVYITDPSAWWQISFGNDYANPMYYGDRLHILDANGEEVTEVVLNSDVTTIPDYAFSDCSSLTSIIIPDSVTSIGDYAFSSCSRLTSITIPDSVTSIGNSAFSGCSKLTYNVYDNAKYLGNSNNPYVALISSSSSSIASYAIHENTNVIADRAFYNCRRLTSITIPNSVTSIGDGAFDCCTSLTGITIPDSVTSIGSEAFRVCESLTSITIPDSVTSIGSLAFCGCSSLTSITIPNSVTSIGGDAFYGCTSLPSITIPDSVTSIGDDAFDNCESLTSITIPDSVTSIGSSAFYGCTSLTDVYITDPSAWCKISFGDTYANPMYYGDRLHILDANGEEVTEVVLNSDVTTIPNKAFYNCTGLTSITIPASVTSIGSNAFYDCYMLEQAVYLGRTEQWANVSVAGGNYDLLAMLVCVGDVRFSGASLTLQDDLTINYRVSKALIGEYGYTSPYVVVSFNGVETTLTQYTEKEDCLEFLFVNIAPNQMHDTLYATLYATYDGIEYSGVTKEYSVAEYCYSMLELYNADEYSELRTLLVDLLNYGAAAQTYTNYKTATPVNAALTETQRGWGTSTEPALQSVLNTKYKTVDTPTAKWKGAGLLLQESVTMRLALTAQDVTDLSVRIESGENTWTIPAEQFEAGDGKYYVYFTGLNAGQMRDTVYLTIYEGDTAVSNTASYSIESYACEMQNSEDAKLVALLKAMMRYGDAASAYVN